MAARAHLYLALSIAVMKECEAGARDPGTAPGTTIHNMVSEASNNGEIEAET